MLHSDTTSTDYDPTLPSCACCYSNYGVDGGDLKRCSRCKSRCYCSRECQVKDWKTGHHKQWCGKAGEKDVDYEIRSAGEKGLGLFVKRDYERGDKILVERPAIITPFSAKSQEELLRIPTMQAAVMALVPSGDSIDRKIMENCVSLGE